MPRTSKANQNAQSSPETISLTDDLQSIDDLEQLARQTALEHAKAFSGDDGPRGQSNLVLSEPMNVLIMVEPKLRQFDVSISKGESRDDTRARVRREVERYTRLVVCAPEYFATELSEGTEYELEFPAGCKVTSIGDMLVKHHSALVLSVGRDKKGEIPFTCSRRPANVAQILPKGENAGTIVEKEAFDTTTRMQAGRETDANDVDQTNGPGFEVLNSAEQKKDEIVLAFESLPKFEQWSLVKLLDGMVEDDSSTEEASRIEEANSPIRLNDFAPEELASHLSSLTLKEESVLAILAWCVEEIDATPSSISHKLEELIRVSNLADLREAIVRLELSEPNFAELMTVLLEIWRESHSRKEAESQKPRSVGEISASNCNTVFEFARWLVDRVFSGVDCMTLESTNVQIELYHFLGDQLRISRMLAEAPDDLKVCDTQLDQMSAKQLLIFLRERHKLSLAAVEEEKSLNRKSLAAITGSRAVEANEATWRKLRDLAMEKNRRNDD